MMIKLPVMKLHYGGSISPISSIRYKLDGMVCSGKRSFYPSELATAERDNLKSNVIKLREELIEKIDFIAVRTISVVPIFI